ncbi:glycosyltransferase [Candidatus Fermentibacteria bacterium]|nr:glycosyltransferase [Candidatus Fermentibacteria bacterium]
MKAAFYSYLPTGGAVRVAGHQLYHLRKRFQWRAHLPEGGAPLLPESGVPVHRYAFPHGRRLRGLRRLFAPVLLWRKALAYDRLCGRIAAQIDADGAEVLLVHPSMIQSSPPLLYMTNVPSVFYCEEYPRYIYEPGMRKTGHLLTELLILPLLRREKRLDRLAARKATVLVANSRYMAGRLQEVYDREAVAVLPGVDADVFTPGGGKEGYVLTVGALSHYKRHHLVVEALGMIPDGDRPPMVTVGDRGSPGYRESLRALASRLDVDLTILQGIPDERLIDLYRNAFVVACPQRNEPYGLVPLEAMACGTPAVAVDQGGFRENVLHGENGLLVPVSSRAMADAFAHLRQNPGMIEEMGRKGREFVVSSRSSRVEADTVARLMEEAAGK